MLFFLFPHNNECIKNLGDHGRRARAVTVERFSRRNAEHTHAACDRALMLAEANCNCTGARIMHSVGPFSQLKHNWGEDVVEDTLNVYKK